ncbi:Hypothetical predicted protein [Cloeon dipterum]|uniref:J domain-containing protein n=1 Tax=Cloeon dipterum TaxID=197152 RepID=A0A8S1CVP6_9INSE|nr:Hypothetical predicted protein [Cloeon dipterum]
MGGQKFQYDESGGTFFYFLISFLALLLVPGTYYYWPRSTVEDPEKERKLCQCAGCKRKRKIMESSEPWKGAKNFMKKLLIVLGWVFLIFLTYKVSQFDYEMANFDPYDILKVSSGASQAEIKKAYRKLSLILHPDKETGNEKAFMKLNKAYQALTDDEARKNWEKYGNPDGPGVINFGIALPSWIVEKENSVWVLGLYALVFMIALPTVVGMWWYRSIRYSGDQVLLDTQQLYYYFFHKTPVMPLKRALMILAASLEYDKKHNSEIVERPSDNVELPQLIRNIENLNEKTRERPLSDAYSLKARALLFAHMGRMLLPENSLEIDRQYIVKKCPYLIQEMVNCVSQLIMLAYARRINMLPKIETIENVMKLSPMIVQGLWDNKSPLRQLPHIQEENLKWFSSKKRHIKNLQQLAQLPAEDRRALLKSIPDENYSDIMKVLGNMPYIDFQVRCEVIDDEEPTVYTAGAIVTVTVILERKSMAVLFGDESAPDKTAYETKEDEEETEKKEDAAQVKKPPAWLKQKKGKKSSKKGSKKLAASAVKPTTAAAAAPAPAAATPNTTSSNKKSLDKVEEEKKAELSADPEDSELSDDEAEQSEDSDDEPANKKKTSNVDDDDKEWEKFQDKLAKREKVLEGRSKTSHSVHCPLYPDDKQEYWWVYISDRKSHTLLTAPYHVTALVDTEEIQLKFTAPRWPGVYTFTVCLRSDSYLGFDQLHDIKLDVKEAPEEITDHPQWDFPEGEEEKEGEGSDLSEFTTDEDVEDDAE